MGPHSLSLTLWALARLGCPCLDLLDAAVPLVLQHAQAGCTGGQFVATPQVDAGADSVPGTPHSSTSTGSPSPGMPSPSEPSMHSAPSPIPSTHSPSTHSRLSFTPNQLALCVWAATRMMAGPHAVLRPAALTGMGALKLLEQVAPVSAYAFLSSIPRNAIFVNAVSVLLCNHYQHAVCSRNLIAKLPQPGAWFCFQMSCMPCFKVPHNVLQCVPALIGTCCYQAAMQHASLSCVMCHVSCVHVKNWKNTPPEVQESLNKNGYL